MSELDHDAALILPADESHTLSISERAAVQTRLHERFPALVEALREIREVVGGTGYILRPSCPCWQCRVMAVIAKVDTE